MASRICKFCAGTFQQIFCAAAALACTRRSSLSGLLTTVPRFLLSRCGGCATRGFPATRAGLGPLCGHALALAPVHPRCASRLSASAMSRFVCSRRGHCLPLRKKCRSAFGIACFFVCAVRCAAAPGRSALLHCHASAAHNAVLSRSDCTSRPAALPGLRSVCSALRLSPLYATPQRFCIILTHVPGQMLSNGRQRRKNLVHVPRDATLRPDSGGTRSAAAWHTAGSAA